MEYPNLEIEKGYWNQNKIVVGIDEAGRGCVAGPVVAAAVAFPINFDLKRFDTIPKINDSKKLSPMERQSALEFIKTNAIYLDFAFIDSSIIDEYNILQATQMAMNLSIRNLAIPNAIVLVDGNYFLNLQSYPFETIIKGDSKSFTIASASIVAKVIRDEFVDNYLHSIFPDFAFSEHKGYATKKHLMFIKNYGETYFHRKTFLKKFYLRNETEKFQLKLFE